MHPGIKVQFELDLEAADAALSCLQCYRPKNPDSKHPKRLPIKFHPPQACGMTIFGGPNSFDAVGRAASRHQARFVVLLRRNHLAHAISGYRHFARNFSNPAQEQIVVVPWTVEETQDQVNRMARGYQKLTDFPTMTGIATHFVFYEDMKRRPHQVWNAFLEYLGLPMVTLHDIDHLETKSSSKVSVDYLQNYSEIQTHFSEYARSPWKSIQRVASFGMSWLVNFVHWGNSTRQPEGSVSPEEMTRLLMPSYDDTLNIFQEFQVICARIPKRMRSKVSWRGGTCDTERLNA